MDPRILHQSPSDDRVYAKRMLTHLQKIKEQLPKEKSVLDLSAIVDSLIAILNDEKNNDEEAKKKALIYLNHLPIQVDGEILSLGNYCNVSLNVSPAKVRNINDPEKLEAITDKKEQQYLIAMYNNFVEFFSKVAHDWSFTYPQNHNGEILTQAIGEWQNALMGTKSNPKAAYADFTRDISIDGLKADEYFLISLPRLPNDEALKDILNKTKGACLIKVKDDLYFVHQPNLVKIKLDVLPQDLKKFETENFSMETRSEAQLEEIKSFPLKIVKSTLMDRIEWNISHLCNQLKNPPEEKKLLKAWLEMNGNQDVNRFVDQSMIENHFTTEMITMGKVSRSEAPCWTVKNNQLTFVYTVDIHSVMMGLDSYGKGKDNLVHLLEPGVSKTFGPLMKIDSEVSLVIEKNHQDELVVKPKLTKYTVNCLAGMNDAGEVMLKSPKQNENIISQLTGKQEMKFSK